MGREEVKPAECYLHLLSGSFYAVNLAKLVYPKEPAAGKDHDAGGKKPEDADPAVQAGARRQRRIWLQADVEGNPYDVSLASDAIGADLRRLATPDLNDPQRANIKLFKADGTELDLDGEVPLDAGSLSTSAIRVQGVGPAAQAQLALVCA
eukprot:s3031_g15.t1